MFEPSFEVWISSSVRKGIEWKKPNQERILYKSRDAIMLWKGCMHTKSLQSCPTTCDHMDCTLQALLSKGFSKQEYWSGLPCPPLGDLPDTGIEPVSLTSTALIGRFFTTSASTTITFLSSQSMEYFQRKDERWQWIGRQRADHKEPLEFAHHEASLDFLQKFKQGTSMIKFKQ